LEEHQWDEVIATNLKGAFYGIQEAARVMIPQKEGHIINITSLVGQRGNIGQAAYAASKAGLIGLTRAAARELGPSNIQINAVMPGFLPTRMTAALHNKYPKGVAQENVLGRTSNLKEVARFIRHLSTMKNISGQVYNLDSRIF
jgi:3-oxoacyl-[acyl-carrier protein] reductase